MSDRPLFVYLLYFVMELIIQVGGSDITLSPFDDADAFVASPTLKLMSQNKDIVGKPNYVRKSISNTKILLRHTHNPYLKVCFGLMVPFLPKLVWRC